MRILCIGGGPAGLYAALVVKRADPQRIVRVVERNRASDTFGWGVVFSDQTLGNLATADSATAAEIIGAFNRWDNIDVHFKGRTITSGGHGFCGIGRKRLLDILQRRCRALDVELVFETDVSDDQSTARQFAADVVIACDGSNSRIRQKYALTFKPDVDVRRCRFTWLGTTRKFPAFTFAFEHTPWGWFQAHAYQYDCDMSTFIVETPEVVWQRAGIDGMSQQEGIDFCERVFARYLDGHRLESNAAHLRGSAIWLRFQRVICQSWIHWNGDVPIVLMGDAAHTAHFSVGSGTKLALEDAIAFSRALDVEMDLPNALPAYEAERIVEVLKIQNAARNSTEWFENVARYTAFEAEQFAYSLLTRSQRISHENLRLRDRPFVARMEAWFAAHDPDDAPPPSGKLPLTAPSAVPYGPRNQVPRAMPRADMDCVRDDFVRAAEAGARCEFDWLELHCAHGYLLSAFLCPLTNRRDDDYGGGLENRCRYPLEVFRAIREVWPADKPVSVRVSAHDWAPGGNTPDDAIVIAQLFKDAGADLIDVSSGQTTRDAKPVYGRMYQTPFADRIRNEVGIATMAVGAIFETDHVNSIIMAGRADLCALARPHLADPYCTLHAAAQLGYGDIAWPVQYLAGKAQLERNLARAAQMAAEAAEANG